MTRHLIGAIWAGALVGSLAICGMAWKSAFWSGAIPGAANTVQQAVTR